MEEIITIEGSVIEYEPQANHISIICGLPFICKNGVLYVENPNPEEEKYTVTDIKLLTDDELKVHLDSGDILVIKSHTVIDKYLFAKIMDGFLDCKNYNGGDDKLRIVLHEDKLERFELYRYNSVGDLSFSFTISEKEDIYYLFNYRPWAKNEIESFQIVSNSLICNLKNGEEFRSDIILSSYIKEFVYHIFSLLKIDKS